jgi:hypothetical protein
MLLALLLLPSAAAVAINGVHTVWQFWLCHSHVNALRYLSSGSHEQQPLQAAWNTGPHCTILLQLPYANGAAAPFCCCDTILLLQYHSAAAAQTMVQHSELPHDSCTRLPARTHACKRLSWEEMCMCASCKGLSWEEHFYQAEFKAVQQHAQCWSSRAMCKL